MARRSTRSPPQRDWVPIADPEDRYSSGIPDFDQLLGGGFLRGSLALFHLDANITPDDRDLIFSPILLNFLHQSRGVIAVLPARDSPHGFRERLTRFTTRRRFDARVRICDYVGEDDEAPYVVSLRDSARMAGKDGTAAAKKAARTKDMGKMVVAERAAQGKRKRTYLEFNAFEMIEMICGVETATRMFLHGIKRARQVNNLLLGLMRPGLGCGDSLSAMADTQFELRHDQLGLVIRGVQPAFPDHVVTVDRARGAPHVAFVPGPDGPLSPLPAIAAARARRGG
ncbi:MAG: hypothetical protein L3K18_07305 [Thermoplasmata archaeon]|nr:hypothetical protein [Thermoplasmata archaeon]